MEAFSLLKYWKGGGGGVIDTAGTSPVPSATNATTTTIVTAVTDHSGDTASDSDDGGDDDGPFFDLEFAVPADVDNQKELLEREDEIEEERCEAGEEEEGEFKFTMSSSGSSCDRSDPNLSLSPSDDLFFKGRLVQINGSEQEINSKSGESPAPALSLVRSATKFRVFMLGLKRSKSESATKSQPSNQQNEQQNQKQQQNNNNNNKMLTVKFKAEEIPKISLLLARAHSNSNKLNNTKEEPSATSTSNSPSDEKQRNNVKKEVMQKYLKMVKPLYIRVSRKNQTAVAENVTLARGEGETAESKESPATARGEMRRNLKVIVKKHLGKSKSASSAVHSTPSSTSKRRDDSLLQQQDGIQSAILHCKRSFHTSREDGEDKSSVLSRSVSDPSHQKAATELTREEKGNDVVAA